ncbi:M20 family metallopeptidase [Fodinibius sp. SL11]|uniref:M20 family metallopeptidase n=1 Tax=Fodinibius sp. SL11 TaxID=3425690 RepID=UPI003F881380
MTNRAQQIRNYIEEQKADFISLLQSLVEFETPSDQPEKFTPIWELLSQQFQSLGYTVHHFEGNETAGQLLCKPTNFEPSKPSQLIVGHCDTVWDIGTLNEMPFSTEDNIVTGPGVYDMKAGLAMMIFGIKAIRNLNQKTKVQPIFLINSDEEIGSNESKECIIEQAKLAERTFVLEPSLDSIGKIKTRRKGVGDFEITIKGKPSHAGLAPEEGVSAILGLSHIVQQLFRLNDPANGVTVNVGTIEGGERSNVVAAKSKAVIDVRIPTKEDGERIKNQIYNLQPEINGIELSVTGDINRPPLEQNEPNKKLWEKTQQLGRELEMELQEGMSGGASDGNFTNLYSPTIDGLGAVGEGAHAYHEKIYIEQTLDRLALFTLLLLEPPIFD